MARVSVIMPSFNQASFISEALDSVMNQTFSDWECIVVDDGSTDNTREIVRKYVEADKRFNYLYQDNQGVSAARNNGVRNSCGEYVLPLDADDRISPEYMVKAVEWLETNPDCRLVYCKADKFGAVNGPWKLPEYSFEKMLWDNVIFNAAFFRRSDYDATPGYNENMREGLEDWDFWLTFLRPGDKVHRLDEVLFHYRIKKASRNTSTVLRADGRELLKRIVRNHPELYASETDDVIALHKIIHSLEEERERITSSFSYRLGRALVSPFGHIRDFINSL